MNIVAVKDNVICSDIAEDNKTAGGIIIPETAVSMQKPQKKMVVVSVGESVTCDVKPGDTVVTHAQAGMAIVGDAGEILHVVKDGELYGYIPKGE